ncbi:MAG: Rho-binding antiterminator [Bacteroidota bacterium]
MKEAVYIPINCNYYDKLEAWATLRQQVEIVLLDDSGKENKASGLIADLFIKDKAEYLKLKSGQEIRLDRIYSVNGEVVPGNSCQI